MIGFVWFGICVVIIGFTRDLQGANILAIAPSPAISHYQMLEPLILGLAQRGHHVTVLSNFPQKKNVINVTDIDLREVVPSYALEFSSWGLLDDMLELFTYGYDRCKSFAATDLVQNFLKTGDKFDLIFLEAFDSDCYLAFVAKFKAPYIVFSAMSLPIWESDWIYNPTEMSYYPDSICRLGGKMSFVDRLQNAGCHVLFRGLYWLYNSRTSSEIVRDHFNVNINSLEEIKSNLSFFFANSYYGVTGVRPLLPNVIEIGGIHIKPPKPLPENIDKFLRESPEGVVVISMGSIVKAHTLDPAVRKGFLSAISKLKERVLWKWEVDMPDKPDNLMTVPWLPQADVLSHPKVKLFIAHGGIHGLYEAICHGVPIIGIPLFGDQLSNLRNLEEKGVAVVVEFANLNEKTLSSAINRILTDISYQENAKALSKAFRDQPQTPLERAIFWTEYAIRHKGAPHFKSGALQLSWLQYALVDVLLVCFSFCILIIVVFHQLLRFLRII